MDNPFFERPILNSPYECPSRHWELDETGQPTQRIIETRRRAEFITPIPKPRKRKGAPEQGALVFDEGKGLSTEAQQYDHTAIINGVRQEVDRWRQSPNPSQWRVTPETARLLQHWRRHKFSSIRPFFCQVEAVETAIWLTEVAPHAGNAGKRFLDHLANANNDANPELMRMALKLATGAGKTTVMAMLIAWQTVNAVRHPQSKRFTRGFLIVAPGLTIRDRLRVLQPNDPDSYYQSRELAPGDMLADLERAKIVITNYHAFKPRERLELSKSGRSLLQGRGEPLDTVETQGQMLQRVMPELMGMKNILALNDEAHHCYREKPGEEQEGDLKGDDRKEAERNKEAARLWISGLEAVNRKLGLARVIDLSATPFFLRGSGYAEGTLFPWTMSDFSLMDAIECGIVKLPRVPVADNIPVGSTAHVNFNTSKTDHCETDARRCHINWVILDSDWEAEFCRVAEAHPRVLAYVKNHNLGLEVPYRYGSEMRTYIPDFIVLIDDGQGEDDPLHLIVEIKGYRREDAKEKKNTMETYWVPGVNNQGRYGRWAFAEFGDVWEMQTDFEAKVEEKCNEMIEGIENCEW